MIETNVRIVRPGMNLYVWARRAKVKGSDITYSILQRACGILRHRHGLAAMPCPGEEATLLVATQHPVETLRLTGSDWVVEIIDAGQPAERLTLGDRRGRELIPVMIERAIQAKLAQDTKLWTLDSPSIWYEASPFCEKDGVAAYHRYEVGALFIENEGIGIVVDVGTAFFSKDSLAYYFDARLSLGEQEQRERAFQMLTDRQKGQRGTLLYDNGQYQMKCYFGSAPPGVTCKTTGEIRVKDTSYNSLAEYYQLTLPDLEFNPDGRAIMVSFPHRGGSVWAAPELLYIRVVNENLPSSLRNIDKIIPADRKSLLQGFWQYMGSQPFRNAAPGVYAGFWRPKDEHVHRFALPDLIFGQGRRLSAPQEMTAAAYHAHYEKRSEFLDEMGCYSVPATVPHTLYLAYPADLEKDGAAQLATDMSELLAEWTKRPIKVLDPLPYNTVAEAVSKLAELNAEVVIFILNAEPLAYHDAAFQQPWRIKRITRDVFRDHYRSLKEGAWNGKTRSRDLQRGRRNWDSFVRMNALGVLQLLDAVPYRVKQADAYEAHLGIDVGYDGRHFVISLQIARPESMAPSFRARTDFQIKHDSRNEHINRRLLTDQVIQTIQEAMGRHCDPLHSLLVLRDGQFGSDEIRGIEEDVVKVLQAEGYLASTAIVDYADIRKSTTKAIRLWEVSDTNTIQNVLEGTAVRLNAKMVVLATTGAANLHQGTANPLVIVGNGHGNNVLDSAATCFAGAQHNWSSPRVRSVCR